MNALLAGQPVDIEIVEVNELEAVCWIKDYDLLAYLPNEDLKIHPSDVGKKDLVFVKEISPERITLIQDL